MSKHDEQLQSNNITKEQMLDALKRSGYLMEQRVERFFSQKSYHISNSNYFVDEGTDKLREVDLIAETAHVKGHSKSIPVEGTFTYKLICECENNPQPVVFFNSDAKIAGRGQGLIEISLPSPIISEKTPLNDRHLFGDTFFNTPEVYENHHFFSMPMVTQYCSFVPKDKNRPVGEWVAKHLDEQHDTFTNLLKGANFVSSRDAQHTYDMAMLYYNRYQAFLYYPVLILKDQLFTAKESEGGVELEECNHLVYWRNHQVDGAEHLFAIDIIRESYLPKYLNLIEKEIEHMHFAMLQNPYLKDAIEEWTDRKITSREADSQDI